MGECKEGNCETPKKSSCSSGSCHNTGCCMMDGMMRMADEAWACLMKEKMKAHFEKKRGPHMDKLAEALVEASLAHWESKMEGKAKKMQAMENVKQTMMG